MKRILLLVIVTLIALNSQAATVTFNTIYFGVGSSYTLNSSSIVLTTPIIGANFKFTSANPADVTFSGNNVAGQLTYISGEMTYAVNGVISRKVGNNPYTAFYFAETTVLGGSVTTGKAYLLVVPTKSVTSNSSVGTNSAPVNDDLNSFLTTQTSNNNPPTITSNGAGTNAYISINENITAVTTITSSDVLKGTQVSETATYSITGGVDASKFSINPTTGVLTFVSAPNYESPTDAGLNNIYDVQVTVTDSQGATDVQALSVTITNTNDNSPIITSNGGGSTATVGVVAGNTTVTTVAATDADYGDVLTYTISGGTNSALFAINSASGELTFKSAAQNGSYQVIVRTADAVGNADTQTLTVNVTTTDTTAPTLQITAIDTNLAAGESTTVSFKFSEQIHNFSLSDVTVAGGNLGTITQSETDPTLYTATLTQIGTNLTPSITVANNSYQDMSNNNGTGNSLNLTADITAPTVAVSYGGFTKIAYAETKTVTFTFSENPGASFTESDITVINGTISGLIQTGATTFTASLLSTSAVAGPTVTVKNLSYTDPAGNLGSLGTKSLGLLPPAIDLSNSPTAVAPSNLISDTGTSNTDNITTTTKPVLTGKYSSAGPIPAVQVVYYVNSVPYTIVYKTNGTNNIVVNAADSTFSLNLYTATPTSGTMPANGLPEGSIGISVTDGASTPVILASASFLIDKTAPAAPVVTPITPAYDQTPTISGTAVTADGDVLTVTVNGITYTNGDGYLNLVGTNWTLIIPSANKITPGTHAVTARVTDLAGNVSTDGTTNELVINASSLTIDLKNSATDDTGSSSTDNITTNGKPIISGTSAGTDLTVKITVVSDGFTYTYNSVAVSGGAFSLNLATTTPSSIIPTGIFPTDGLPEGTVSLTVEGNTSGATATSSFVIDLTAPTSPTANSDTTNDTTPAITGTATVGAGEVLRVTINGVTYTNGDGRLSFAAGVWTLNIPAGNALSVNNSYPTTVTVTDAAGNIGTGSGSIIISNATVSIDLANTSASDTGDSSTDNITSNRKPVIAGTASTDAVVTVAIVSGGVTYTFNNVAVVGGVWSLNLATAATTSGAALPTLGLTEGTVSLTVTGNTTAASENATFTLNYTSTTTADGTWTSTTKWDTEVQPNSIIATAVLKHKMSIPESEVIVCKDITLDAGASLTNNADLTIKENLVLKVSNNNNASSIINNGQVINQGRIIIRKSFSRDFGWYFMSFPFDVPANKIFIAGTNTVARWGDPTQAATSTKDFYVSEYDGAKRDNTGVVNYVSNSPNWKDVNPHTFIAKKGYIVAVPGDIEIDFVSGAGETSIFMPNSTVDVLKHTSNQYTYHNSWNLIGIPYATSYKLNLATQTPFYSYNKQQSNYDVIMTADDEYLINPYYSFFMQAADNTINFTSTARMAVKSRLSAPTYDELNLVLKNQSYTDRTRIRLESDANASYVIGSDAVKMFSDVSAVPQLYTHIGACAASYNTLPDTTSTIRLTTKIGVKGEYKLGLTKAQKAPNYKKIILTDSLLNIQQDLLLDSVYTFNSEVGTHKRFKISVPTSNTTSVNTLKVNDITVTCKNKQLHFEGIKQQATVKIYDLNGVLVNEFLNVPNNKQLFIHTKGIIIVKIIEPHAQCTFKLNI